MAEVVAGLLASAFVSIAKDKLGSAIAEQANLLCNFGGDLEGMKDTLETISAVLEDAERRSVMDKQVQLLLKRLRDVALDISDVLEDYQDTSDQATAKNPVLLCIPTSYKKIVVANRMNSLRKELSKIFLDFDNFKFVITQGTSTTNVQHPDKRVTTSYFLAEVEGREGEKQEIINLLHASCNNDESGTVIVPICALGGMGKTTLAQLVYNDEKIKNQYDYRIWVYVSQDFSLLKIGNSMISQLQVKEAQQNRDLRNKDLEVVMQCLENLLSTKKVLIVLDDLWEKADTELTNLKSMLHVGKKVDVIVTTREEGIARKLSTSKVYKLRPLKDDVCWKIIKRSSKKCDQKEFERIGLDIAKKCGGVPLAAQAIGYILQTNHISDWEKINDSDIWKETSDDRVLPSLWLSYQKMPQHLRICFSYCAIFSKGHNIVEDDLIHQWSVLGFVETSKGKEYIKHLLGMSFLQVSEMPSTSQTQEVRYTMHDLVHDLAKLTMADQLKIYDVAPTRKTSAHKYFRYSLLKKYDSTTKLENIPSKMRALHFSDSVQLNIRSGAFSFATCLRILDFSECLGVLLPASIGKLKQLRCLIAPRMQNEIFPNCITELSKLQYLNLNQSPRIHTLPDSVGKLGYLQYLCLSGCSSISELPKSFGDLKSMVHLDMSGCSGMTAVPECICELSKLQHLNINGSSQICSLPESIGKLGCLKYLSLSGCSAISKLPESFGDLKCMVHLDMSGCCVLTELPHSIGNLTRLQHLKLSECSGLKALPDSLCGLTQLQYLNLSWCCYLNELPESMMKLQSLSHLELSRCWRLRRGSLTCLRGLTALQHLDISCHYEVPLLDDFIGSLTNLEHLDVSWNLGIEYLPESIGNLKRLHTLDLSECRNLESLPESIGALGLKSLLLQGCSDAVLDQASSLVNFLQILPFFKVRDDYVNGVSNLHLLENVHVNELRIFSLENVRSLDEATKVKLSDKHNLSELTLAWSSSLAFRFLDDHDLLGQLVPPSGLKSMCLEGYRCTSFPGWLMCICSDLTNLVSIRLGDMPTCNNLPPLGQLSHLKKLELFNIPSIQRIDREFCGDKGAFRQLSSFSIEYMDGLEEWNTTYSFVEDGVEEFMFPVLDRLKINRCPRLRLKPCLPTFRECSIWWSNQVIYSLEKAVDQISQISLPSSRAIKLDLDLEPGFGESMIPAFKLDIFLHHFPALQELTIFSKLLTSLPESMRHLSSLESLKLKWCSDISALPEWLGDLSSLKSLVIKGCEGIKSLPACIQQLTKLQKLKISYNQELKEWCESEENKTKLAHINNMKLND